MMHQPIRLTNLSFYLPQRTCFQDFNTKLIPGERIGIIGRNGSGKSSLLKMIAGVIEPSAGEIFIPGNAKIAYVPQIINEFKHLSGGERFNQALTVALTRQPNILLLDEPTNHLDQQNRNSLFKMLQHFQGTFVIASHDSVLLNQQAEKLWCIEEDSITIFNGSFSAYQQEKEVHYHQIKEQMIHLKRAERAQHQALMREQERSKKRRAQGEKHIKEKKWPTVVSAAKMNRSVETSVNNKQALHLKKEKLQQALQSQHLPAKIIPKFHFLEGRLTSSVIVSVRDGTVGYQNSPAVLQGITFSLSGQERLVVKGRNGSGKSTLVKAICGHKEVQRQGEWQTPQTDKIAYLDQHYHNLDPALSVFDSIQKNTLWNNQEIRRHLNDFLFRKNEEICTPVSLLSGGEKARLSLALIAARTPSLLILDEITNNIDSETRMHVIEVLKAYQGALILISHDEDFLDKLGVTTGYEVS